MVIPPELVTALVTAAVVGITVVFHYEVIQLLDRWCSRGERELQLKAMGKRPIILGIIFVLLLAHVAEIWLFGVATWMLLSNEGYGAVSGYPDITLLDSTYFSAANYTTVGWGDLVATGHIRFLAGTEALVGFMMITWSASFGYLIMARTMGRENNKQ